MKKRIIKGAGIVLTVTIVTIFLHIFLPADATSNSVEFDSSLVKAIGFSILPFVGMYEISPDTVWTPKVSFYQTFIGLGDALPVLLLAYLMYKFCSKPIMAQKDESNKNTVRTIKKEESIKIKANHQKASKDTYQSIRLKIQSKILLTFTVAASLIIERMICYKTGITLSAMKDYPIPCILWTILFGIGIGIICTILYPVYTSIGYSTCKSTVLMILTLGINWILFNNFIAMIASNMVVQMTIRSSIDVMVVILCINVMKGKIQYEEI